MELISVHVPKCAGTSLRESLIATYGPEGVFFDNADRLLDPKSPINTDRDGYLWTSLRERDQRVAGKRAVHGHFCVRKYDGVDALRVTILRHPVDRLISHYYFWKGLGPHGHSLHDQFLAEKPGLLEFARMPMLRHFYTEVMFRDVDMGMFDLIGSMENIRHDMAALGRLIGHDMMLKNLNQNAAAGYQEGRTKVVEDPAIRAALHDLLAGDIAFYERHIRG